MDMSEATRMSETLRGMLRENEPMARHVSWRAGGSARLFFQPVDVPDLCAFLKQLAPRMPVMFLGLGSNLLVRDGDVVVTMGAGSIGMLAAELSVAARS